MARPVKLDDPMPGATKPGETRREYLLGLLRQGAFLDTAARAAGIHPATLHEWIARGRGQDPRGRRATPAFVEFAEAVDRARAEAEVALLLRLQTAARGGTQRKKQQVVVIEGKPEVVTTTSEEDADWKAAAWLLERTWAGRYGRRQAVEVTAGEQEGAGGVEASVRDAEAMSLAKRFEAFAAERGIERGPLEPPEVEVGADGMPIEDAVVVEDPASG